MEGESLFRVPLGHYCKLREVVVTVVDRDDVVVSFEPLIKGQQNEQLRLSSGDLERLVGLLAGVANELA